MTPERKIEWTIANLEVIKEKVEEAARTDKVLDPEVTLQMLDLLLSTLKE